MIMKEKKKTKEETQNRVKKKQQLATRE